MRFNFCAHYCTVLHVLEETWGSELEEGSGGCQCVAQALDYDSDVNMTPPTKSSDDGRDDNDDRMTRSGVE
jgi:hypothetical protein